MVDVDLLLPFSSLYSDYFIVSLFPSSMCPPFFVIWWFSIVVCFDSFIFIFCISSIGFCFVVPCSLPETSYSYSRVFRGDNILPLHVKKFNIFTLSSNILFLISQFASFYCIYKQIIVVNTIKRKWQKVKKN